MNPEQRTPPADYAAFEARLRVWLHQEAGVPEWRRLARLDSEVALVSKFGEGFAPQLHALLDALPELVDERAVIEAYRESAALASPGTTRVEAWDRAMRTLLGRACARLASPRPPTNRRSSASASTPCALLESILWTAPTNGEAYAPAEGERAAYLDVTRAFAGRDFFTRTYGAFEDRLVQNHCPGSAYARVMLAQAWLACTGTPPPAEESAA